MARTTSSPAGATALGADGAPAGRRRPFRRRPKTSGSGGPGRIKQMRDVFAMTRRVDPSVTWWVLGTFLVVFAVLLGLTLLLTDGWYWTIVLGLFSLMVALLAALFVLARRAETAAYGQLEGQPGAAGAALRTLRRGWTVEEQPVAVDPRTRDTVFRAVGRPGVVLVSDGPAHRVTKLLEAERRRVTRVLPDVPVHLLQSGSGEEQVPLGKLPRRVMRLRPKLTKAEVTQVNRRLKALGTSRPPIPAGIDPMRARPDRKGARR